MPFGMRSTDQNLTNLLLMVVNNTDKQFIHWTSCNKMVLKFIWKVNSKRTSKFIDLYFAHIKNLHELNMINLI